MSDKLFVVHGAGNDAVGLVQRITTGIAQVGGNIIDLRQDALHGLFTIYLVADLEGSDLRLEGFREVIARIGEDSGLSLNAERHVPAAHREERPRALLLILVGRDRPGIISTVSKDLSSHQINIEFCRMVAREGIFLMELLTDITHCTLPPENLEAVVREHMEAVGIATMFQSRDVFNPKKRVILFDISGSFIAPELLGEVLQQAGLSPQDLPQGQEAAQRLEGLPAEVFQQIVESMEMTPDTTELVHSLKRMGYRIALSARAFAPFTEVLRARLGLDHAFGPSLSVDDDSQTLTGQAGPAVEREQAIARVMAAEGVERQDLSVIADDPQDGLPPGLRIQFNMKRVLDYLNQRILSRETLSGVLGSFGKLR